MGAPAQGVRTRSRMRPRAAVSTTERFVPPWGASARAIRVVPGDSPPITHACTRRSRSSTREDVLTVVDANAGTADSAMPVPETQDARFDRRGFTYDVC